MTMADKDIKFQPEKYEGRHPSTVHIVKCFAFDHLPLDLQVYSAKCWELAEWYLDRFIDGPELTVALRRLLEAKDGFVRHYVIS